MNTRLRLVQALRGLAALIVVLHHISTSSIQYFRTEWMADIFKVGWSGVDFFFVLSGFIMVFVHLKDVKTRSNVSSFFYKRFIRIYPVYWIIASISLLFYFISGQVAEEAWGWKYILKSYLLIPQGVSPFVGVAWSLIFELFFYFVFGIGIFMGFKVMKLVLPLWFLIILISNTVRTPLSGIFIFHAYILEFLVGCIVGYCYHCYFNGIKKYRKLLLIGGMTTFLCMWFVTFYFDFGRINGLESRLIFGMASALIILGAALADSTERKLKIPGSLLLLGNSSYVLYLIHPLVLEVVYKLSSMYIPEGFIPAYTFYVGLIAVILSVLTGILFHLLIEKNLINQLNNIRGVKNVPSKEYAALTVRN